MLRISSLIALSLLFGAVMGCRLPEEAAQAQSTTEAASDIAAVETAIAESGALDEAQEFTGTTEPIRQVSLRSQAEGQILDLGVDVGDSVAEGQVLGQVDNRLLVAAVNQARAELAALRSEVAQAAAEVSDARTLVEQARIQFQQAQADAERLRSLSSEGAITEQQAEQSQTAALTAEQAVRSAQEQVSTREQAVIAAQGRVAAQQATVSEVQAREAYSLLTSPITGAVLEQVLEPGDYAQPGDEILKLGDFSAIKVVVQISELELSAIRVGQPTRVRLDAFPDQEFNGEVARISPSADPAARLVPIEVIIPNLGSRISSGLLARVQFQSNLSQPVVVRESALRAGGEENESVIFVVEGEGDNARAIARPVQIGDRRNGQVEILSGLQPGEAFVVQSSQPLVNEQPVRLSILSEQ